MHKKHKLRKLHSIPIGLCKNRYLVSYSIPLSCMVVLLLGGIVAINPSLPLKSSAVTIQDEWVVKEKDELEDTAMTLEDDANAVLNNALSDADAGISPMSIVNGSSLTISLGKTSIDASTVQGGNTAYASNTVTLTGSYVKDYTLSLKAASSNLTMPSGASSSTSTVSGVGSGTVGSSIGTNKWGYAVTETTNTNYSGLTYKTVPATSNDTIASGAGNTESSSSMNVSKQLVFAAKFGSDVTPGKYSASITLSATATPKALTMANITDMQDMTPEICAASSTGQTATLRDSRDSNSYTVIKQSKDQRCWMQQNLRLSGSRTLAPSDSNVSNNWTLPATQASNASTWTSDNTAVMSRTGTTEYGNYYTWCAATAGTCSGATSGGQVASGSICPKGWHLPTGGSDSNGTGELGMLLNGVGSTAIIRLPYNYPYAGYVEHIGSLLNAGNVGNYWASTAYSSIEANIVFFNSDGSFDPGTSKRYRRFGCSVRCVADH